MAGILEEVISLQQRRSLGEYALGGEAAPQTVAELEEALGSAERAEMLAEGLKLKKSDAKVIDAFLDKKSASSKKLDSTGNSLDGLWMGGKGIARWVGGKIQFADLGSKAAQTVQRAIRKKAPKNWLGEEKEAAFSSLIESAPVRSIDVSAEPVDIGGVELPAEGTAILTALSEADGGTLSAPAIAEVTGLDKSTVRHELALMAQGNLVARLAPNADTWRITHFGEACGTTHGKRKKRAPKSSKAKRVDPARVESVEVFDSALTETIYNVLAPGPQAHPDTDVAKLAAQIKKGVGGAVKGRFFRVQPSLKFGTGGIFVDYANIPASSPPGSLEFLNASVQVRLSVDGFDGEGNLRGAKVKVEKLTSPIGLKVRAKTGTPDQVAKHIVNVIKKAAALGKGEARESDDYSQAEKDRISRMGVKALVNLERHLSKQYNVKQSRKNELRLLFVKNLLTRTNPRAQGSRGRGQRDHYRMFDDVENPQLGAVVEAMASGKTAYDVPKPGTITSKKKVAGLNFEVLDMRGQKGFPMGKEGFVYTLKVKYKLKQKYTGIEKDWKRTFVIRTDAKHPKKWRIDEMDWIMAVSIPGLESRYSSITAAAKKLAAYLKNIRDQGIYVESSDGQDPIVEAEGSYKAQGPLEKMIGEMVRGQSGKWLSKNQMKAIVNVLAKRGITKPTKDSYDDIARIVGKTLKGLMKGESTDSVPVGLTEAMRDGIQYYLDKAGIKGAHFIAGGDRSDVIGIRFNSPKDAERAKAVLSKVRIFRGKWSVKDNIVKVSIKGMKKQVSEAKKTPGPGAKVTNVKMNHPDGARYLVKVENYGLCEVIVHDNGAVSSKGLGKPSAIAPGIASKAVKKFRKQHGVAKPGTRAGGAHFDP